MIKILARQPNGTRQQTYPMRTIEERPGAPFTQFGLSLLMMTAVGLHCFTAITAYGLVAPGWWRYVAVLAALAFPVVSEAVVAYYAWRASGSMVNAYSIWLLAWLLLFLVVLWIVTRQKRLARN